jgi:predicted CXXCH cytochrome family protein
LSAPRAGGRAADGPRRGRAVGIGIGIALPLLVLVLGPALAATAGCGPSELPADGPRVPEQFADCHACHRSVVEAYLGHGMAESLGAVHDPPRGTLVNPRTGTRYEFAASGADTTLTATAVDGGRRRQLVVGRIGAGVIDRSFVTVEWPPDGPPSDRLQFAPVEALTGHGLSLSPFEHDPQPVGLDQPVTARCLGCHTTRKVAGPDMTASGTDFPRQLLGRDALLALPALGCDACHGATGRHVAIMQEREQAAPDDIGIARLADLGAGAQRDVCAACHLEGDAHIELSGPPGYGPRATPLAAARPVLVPERVVPEHRLVSQLERLALSACFRAAPDMTCTSCHDPHRAVAAQGTAAFDAACMRCHADGATSCSRGPERTVQEVTREAARSRDGCVDCHVRRSQPFDVLGLRTADHFVQRTIERPATVAPRHAADPDGPLRVYDDGRLAPLLATPGGAAWARGLVGLGYHQQGRHAEAAEQLLAFPPPGTENARRPSAPDGLPPLERSAEFHHVRGLLLEALGDLDGARAAYGDALACDDGHPEARLNRGHLRLLEGDLAGCLEDVEVLLARHPRTEKGWNLLARARARLGDLAGAADALQRSVDAWPADPGAWHELGRLRLALGDAVAARSALLHAYRLQPSRPGLGEDLAAAGSR